MNKQHLNVFSGPNAVRDFLNPDNNPMIPLVELPDHCNPFRNDGVHIYAKLMNMLPLANIKSLPAFNMLLEAEESDRLKNVHTLIENSSGNTVFSLATIARLFGIEKTKAIVSHEVTWGKLQLLRLFGTQIFVNEEPICPDPSDKESGIYKARQQGKRNGWFNPGQYDNEANPRAHTKWTAPQIWKQTAGKISVFCAGLGTTGTILGVGEYLKKKTKKIVVVGVARLPNNPVPGVRTRNLLREIGFDWQQVTDHVEEVGTKESFGESLKLCQAGLMVGPSSGLALAGLFRFLSKQKETGNLDRLRNKEGRIVAVFICPDSPLPYLNEYFEYLDESDFPPIENEQLLVNKPDRKREEVQLPSFADVEMSAEEAYKALYAYDAKELWNLINKNKPVSLKEGVTLIDVRTREEYLHAYLPCAENLDYTEAVYHNAKLVRKWQGKKVIVICRSGGRSLLVAQALRSNGIEASSIRGGMIEWSRLHLPRWRPEVCRVVNGVSDA
ncbi:MAG: pyridoxal-phosphate dependent enzyme [Acidobacteria bacterium]|nr:MAG: pyridoxal-phosphate dependent enzyme [Acidobacteriota bacterium]